MSRIAYTIEIDRLVLRGLASSPGQAERLRTAIEAEVTRLLARPAVQAALSAGEQADGAADAARLFPPPSTAWTGADDEDEDQLARRAARRVAAAVFEQLRQQSPLPPTATP